MNTGPFVAIDLGATSGRVIAGRVRADAMEIEEVHRFANEPIRLPDGLHWNITDIYRQVIVGLRKAAQTVGTPLGIGIDSWAVDYGLLDGDGRLVGIPYHYRDERTARGVERVHEKVSAEDLYARTGIQFLPLNTVYQLAADQLAGTLDAAATMLMIPDLVGYWLTGRRWTEATNASTTALVAVRTQDWDGALIERLGFARSLFPEILPPGTIAGPILPEVRKETGLEASTSLTLVGSHDTASAVVGVPALGTESAYISCGTWALVGLELETPVVTDEARVAGFTNELGVDGKTRFLHNVMGLWLLEECLRHWQSEGKPAELRSLLEAAAALPAGGATIDPNDPLFFPPGAMPERIQAACGNSGQSVPRSAAQVVRCIVDSLAQAFAATIRRAQELSGLQIEVVHLVGGGSRNELLCELTAQATGLPVLAGPAEAAAIGNLLIQARALGAISGSLADLRALIRETQAIERYEPAATASAR